MRINKSVSYSYTHSLSHSLDLEPEHELKVMMPEPEDGNKVSNDPTSPGLVQYRPRDILTGIGPDQIFTALVFTAIRTVHLDGISLMSLAVSNTLSH